MALRIETFSNVKGGNALFKALSHPVATAKAEALRRSLSAAGRVAIYDPYGFATGFAELYGLAPTDVASVFVQDIADIGKTICGNTAQPVTDLAGADADLVFVAAFDTDRLVRHIEHLMPEGAALKTLDDMRLPENMLGNTRRYLDPNNFATNFAFFRDERGHHTRMVTANYWSGYGAGPVTLYYCLFDRGGRLLAEWREALSSDPQSIVVDSREVRTRFGLDDFAGQLFIHAIGAAGHDTVKYVLDTDSDEGAAFSCTHDANAWPADFYAGLPAPAPGEKVILWIQNSYPCAMPEGVVGLNLMGSNEVAWLDRRIPPYGSYALDVAELLPKARWPQQIEIEAGRYFVRPRYEIKNAGGRRRIAHVNVERTDLAVDPGIPELRNLMGKVYVLPAPVLPTERWKCAALPTPMSTAQAELPVAALVFDASGREVARHRFGALPRNHESALELDPLIEEVGGLPSGYGHLELVYDFTAGGSADGWLHGLFRYTDRDSGHAADTSFGAHIFNTVLTYKNEPQSYIGVAPGLSTRLFLRLGPAPSETLCHLIYAASTPWRGASETELILFDGAGSEVARHGLNIPCGGSYFWRYTETFDQKARRCAGDRAYVLVRDLTCRLFGYHGLINGNGAFSLDHMFGF